MSITEVFREIPQRSEDVIDTDKYTIWSINRNNKREEKVYTYDEAIDLAGNGWYIFGLLGVLLLVYEGMSLDMFGLAAIISGACDLELTHYQKNILLSMPFLGSILMAYIWGYVADTQGRRKSLILSLCGSFILASASAFSPNWIVFGVLRFGGISLSSGIQSLGITLLGESCSQKFKGPLLIVVATSLLFVFPIYSVLGYFILKLQFAFDLGFIVFSPWRLLTLVLALPLGVSVVLLTFFYESPTFVLNAGNEEQALEILRKIRKRNGGDPKSYPVQRVKLNEIACLKRDGVSFLQSLKDQTFPLFRPPLLGRILKLFYITVVIYAQNNGFFSWIPFIIDSFYSNSTNDNMCDIIVASKKLDDSQDVCVGIVKETTIWIGIIQTVVYSVLSIIPIVFSKRKKVVMMGIFVIMGCSGVLIPLVSGRLLAISFFYGFMINVLCITIVFSFYVDLFPTSYRGMAACLGVMVARISGLIGTNLVGMYLSSYCATSFYAWAFLSFSGAVVTWFLPSDTPK